MLRTKHQPIQLQYATTVYTSYSSLCMWEYMWEALFPLLSLSVSSADHNYNDS